MNPLKIHDIKPLVEVSDYSLYLFILLILGIAVLFIYLIYFLYKKRKSLKQNKQKLYIQALKKMDLQQSKQAAYDITKNISNLLKNEQQTFLAKDLLDEIQQYKYKEQVNPFDKKTLAVYKKFLETL